ncbi:MAG: hypothetical protein L0Z68_01140 [Gammaproteobacteria bacterium]|nr:hypothetical protein [Gammaproteobacteria bacterium]
MRLKRTHRLHALALCLVCALGASRAPTAAYAEQGSVILGSGEPRNPPRTSVHIDFQITIPKLLKVSFPSSGDDTALPHILANSGLVTVTAGGEAFTYVGIREREGLLLSGQRDGLSFELVSGPGLQPQSADVALYTVAVP